MMGITPRQLLRIRGTPYNELGLADERLSDDDLIDAMMAHPILMNRPVVVRGGKAILARPSENVLELFPDKDLGAFSKEDGQIVGR
jgi:arsenate reductase